MGEKRSRRLYNSMFPMFSAADSELVNVMATEREGCTASHPRTKFPVVFV